MNKTEFAKRIAERNELTLKSAKEVVDMVVNELTEVLKEHDNVHFQEIGTFGTEFKDEHQGRNPATGETITIPAKHIPTFKFSGRIKEVVK